MGCKTALLPRFAHARRRIQVLPHSKPRAQPRLSRLRYAPMIAVHCGAGYHSQALEAAYKRGEWGRLRIAAPPWACLSMSRRQPKVMEPPARLLQTSGRPAGRARPRCWVAAMPLPPSLLPSKCSRQAGLLTVACSWPRQGLAHLG